MERIMKKSVVAIKISSGAEKRNVDPPKARGSSLMVAFLALCPLSALGVEPYAPPPNVSYEYYADFENPDDRPLPKAENPSTFYCSGNCPTVVEGPVRAGRTAMKTYLNPNTSSVTYRTEAVTTGGDKRKALFGTDYWYGFSVFLPTSYIKDSVWEIVAQWHGKPDVDLGEFTRNPVLDLQTTSGNWTFTSRWDANRLTQGVKGSPVYGGVNHYKLGPYETGKWTDWVVHVNWSHEGDGILRVWKNGQLVIDEWGPNAYNDAEGPIFVMGLYKGWKNGVQDIATSRTLFHDELRISKGASAKYEHVDPSAFYNPPGKPPGSPQVTQN